MRKIIAALDGLKLSASTMEHAIHIATRSNAHVVGVFLDDFTYHSYKFSDITAVHGDNWEQHVAAWNKADEEKRQNAITRFEEACQAAGINFSIHRDKSIAYQELVHESIYSDLVIINSRETFTPYQEAAPTRFLRDVLADTQCPVMVVPDTYRPLSKNIILYDGDPSAVYAVKMFSYTLPDLKHLETEVVSVKSEKQTLHLPDGRLMKEFMKRHFPNAIYTVLKGEPEEEIVTYLRTQGEDVLVVLGAYDRSRVSRWFKESMADNLLSHINVPFFIAHNK